MRLRPFPPTTRRSSREETALPWYWTDDLAHTLIDSGRVDRSRVRGWLAAPVAIRSAEGSAQVVADALLGDEEEEDGPQPRLAAA